MVDRVAQAMGLPSGILGGQMDGKAIMDSLVRSHPDLQKALGDSEVQKSLNVPGQKGLERR